MALGTSLLQYSLDQEDIDIYNNIVYHFFNVLVYGATEGGLPGKL